MKSTLLAACVLIASPCATGSELKPVANGDSITGIGVYTGQGQDGSLTYSRIGEVTYKVVIDIDGNRRYVDRGGSPYWIFDRHFTRLLFRGVDLAADQRFALLPPGGNVAPGMRWEVPVHQTRTLCGFAEARYKAVAEKGPDLPLLVDGKEVKVPTVRILYETPLRCEGRPPWLRMEETIFSPELYEIVQSSTVNYDGLDRGPLQLGDPGRGWRLQSTTTGLMGK